MCDRVNGWIRKEKRQRLYMRGNLRCAYCGVSLHETPELLTLDHVTPVENGGTNRSRNLVVACLSCNCAKQGKSVSLFAQYLERTKGLNNNIIRKRVRRETRRRLPPLIHIPFVTI